MIIKKAINIALEFTKLKTHSLRFFHIPKAKKPRTFEKLTNLISKFSTKCIDHIDETSPVNIP